jgi:hypothetical protein
MARLLAFLNQHVGVAGLLAFANAIVFSVLALITPGRSLLFILAIVGYTVAGLLDISARRIQVAVFSEKPALYLLTVLNALSLVYMTTEPTGQSIWLGMIGLSILPLLVIGSDVSEQDRWIMGIIPLIASIVAGILLADGTLAVMGWGVLVISNITAHLSMPLIPVTVAPTETTTPNTSPSPMPPKEETQEVEMQMHVTVDGLVRSVQAINEATHQQSSSAGEQSDVIKLTNTLLEDFLSLSERISGQALSVTKTAQTTEEISDQGQEAISQAIIVMDELRQQVATIGKTIFTLATLTQRIDEIINSVSEIATQSNLLALNASIEAARAGAHGRGFAVVADEVRSLAQQSTEAAAQVRAILAEIQNAMKETIRATEVGMDGVNDGVSRTQEANEVIVQLSESVTASNSAVRDIYEVIRQQADGLEEISISMDRIQMITQNTMASTRAVEAVSTNLTRLASDLQTAVGQVPELD